MDVRDRQDRIVAYLQEHRSVGVDALAQSLGASRETIRRDLSRLAERGLVRKIHGGAVLQEVHGEGAFNARLSEHRVAKRRIAQTAAALFRPGDSLFIDNGSTTLAFAEELAKIGGISVVTNGTLIATALAQTNAPDKPSRQAAKVFLIGGAFAGDGVETVGPLAIEQLRRFHAQHALITIGALDAVRGVMDHNIDEAQIARAMIEQTDVLTVIADGSKLGRNAMFEVCPLADVDRLITDVSPSPELGNALNAAGIEIIVAASEAED